MAESKDTADTPVVNDVKATKTMTPPKPEPTTDSAEPIGNESEAAAGDSPTSPVLRNKTRIEPLHKDTAAEEDSDEPAPEAKARADSSESFDEPDDPDQTKKSPDETNAEAIKVRQQVEREEAVNKLIESRQYYLPINQVQRRRTKQLIWLSFGIVVVVGLAWTYLLLDARLITIPGVSVPTHFFAPSNKPL